MNAADRLDQTRVLAALGAIAKAAPDLAPVYSCDGAEVDIEVPDLDTAAQITWLLDEQRAIRGDVIHDGGYGGLIAGVPVRILITRTRRGSVWAA